MTARGAGHLVFVSSLFGKAASGGASVYAATKFGLRGFAHGLREDLRAAASACRSCFPGFIRDAGMFHESGAKLPPFVGTKTPEDVASGRRQRDRARPRGGRRRPAADAHRDAIASLAPETAATVQRKLGADEIATQVEDSQRR